MRLFIDEDLSPTLTGACHGMGYDATCSRNRQMLGRLDHEVAQVCFDEERVLVTNNTNDFFDLAGDSGLHPGLIVMPLRNLDGQQDQMRIAIEFIEAEAAAVGTGVAEFMINKVVEVNEDGTCAAFEYPPPVMSPAPC